MDTIKVQHSNEVKAAAMAALLDGQSVRHVAKEYSLPQGTVATWSRNLRSEPMEVSEDRGGRIGDLVFDNLEAMLRATTEIVQHVSKDKEWLKRQSASELGVFLGILNDKAFRILEALPGPEERA